MTVHRGRVVHRVEVGRVIDQSPHAIRPESGGRVGDAQIAAASAGAIPRGEIRAFEIVRKDQTGGRGGGCMETKNLTLPSPSGRGENRPAEKSSSSG